MTSGAEALLRQARRAVAFTGAGVSTESGIPDFRSPGTGRWAEYDVREFAYPRFVESADARRKYWGWAKQFWPTVRDAAPNAAHLALAELERRGTLRCVITQNVDGLHQKAGSREVIELHGNGHRVVCLSCGALRPRAEIHERLLAGDDEPRCVDCGGILKPTVVQFGQGMPPDETRRAFDEASSCDLLLAIGSSLVVHPAARLVPTAHAAGARLIIVNLAPTPFDDLADFVIHDQAGPTLSALLRALG